MPAWPLPVTQTATWERFKPFAFLIFVALCLFFFVRWESFHSRIDNAGSISVDVGFILAMPELFRIGAHFGRDVVFTYGPWGMLASGVVQWKYYGLTILLQSGFVTAVALIIRDVMAGGRSTADKAGSCAVLLILLALWLTGMDQGIWFMPSLYLGIVHVFDVEERPAHRNRAIAFCAAACAAMAGLVKFNIFVQGLSIQLIILALDVWARRMPVIGLTWVTVTICGWLAASQSIADLGTWITASLDLSAGYADAMAKGFFKPYSPAVIAMLVFGLMAFMACALVVASQARRKRTIAAITGCLGISAFLAWQHASGGNQLPQSVSEIVCALFVAGAIPKVATRTWNTSSLKRLTATISIALFLIAMFASNEIGLFATLRSRVERKAAGVSELWHNGLDQQRKAWDVLMASIRRTVPLDVDIHGTADTYPQHTAVVIADPRLSYTPRPAYLSLNAHTQALAQMNAEFLRQRGPENILFDVLPATESVNNRLPSTADGPSWPLIWTHYAVAGETKDFLVLTRRPQPLQLVSTPLLSAQPGWGEQVSLPPTRGGLTWATIKVRPSALGRLIKTIYKAPHVNLQMTLSDGTTKTYQIVPALGEAGFLLSPFVSDNAGFLKLMENAAADRGAATLVTSFAMITEPGMNWFWSKNIELSLSDLVIDGGRRQKLPADVAKNLVSTELRNNARHCLFPSALEPAPGIAEPVSVMHAPCLSHLAIPQGAIGVKLTYGMKYVETTTGPDSDGADVKVVASDHDGKPVEEFTRYLDPARQTQDRGLQTMTLHWPSGNASTLTIGFGSGPNNDPTYDRTYVAAIDYIYP